MTHAELQAAVADLNRRIKAVNPSAFVAMTVRTDHFAVGAFMAGWGATESEVRGHTPEQAIQKFETLLSARLPDRQPQLRLA